MSSNTKKFIDLFCGAGGLSCGLQMAGFEPIAANELDPLFAATYKTNHPNVDMLNDDIRLVSLSVLDNILNKHDDIDLVAGGPPCQGYSIIAPKRSIDDPRNNLFMEFMRIVNHIRPKAVIIENVPGIVSFENGLVVEKIYEALDQFGYKVAHKILCAAHYGVPQMRFRTFFVGIRGYNNSINFPFPTHKCDLRHNFTGAKKLCFNVPELLAINFLPQTSIIDAIGDMPVIDDSGSGGEYEYGTEPVTAFQKYARKGSLGITSHFCAKLSDINRERLKFIPPGGSWRDIPFELLPAGLKKSRRSDHTKRYGRLTQEGLCSTIQTKCDPHWGCFFHPYQERVISVREAARIQSFPDRVKFLGGITQQYKQVGNAVPPLLGNAVGQCVMKMLRSNDEGFTTKK